MTNYNIRVFNRKKQWYRLRLGFIQILHHPVLSATFLIPFIVAVALDFLRKEWLSTLAIPTAIQPLFSGCLHFVVFFVPALIALLILQGIGEAAAKKIEAKISLCFDDKHLRHGTPLLASHKYKASRHYYEFQSYIPMSVWQDRKDTLADMLDCRIISIDYGKHGDRVVLTIAKGRKTRVEGRIYDERL